tara:strand:+ start:17 stop:124 length:108 start_codon:yes stop_codon:yes gene_type:complete
LLVVRLVVEDHMGEVVELVVIEHQVTDQALYKVQL